MRTELQERADILASSLQRSVDACFEVLRSISQLFASSGQVKRADFTRFVQPVLARHPSIQALEWLPRLGAAERLAFEQAIQLEYPNFQVTEQTPVGEIVRAQPRSEYFPVCYVEPFDTNQLALGFDLASDAIRRSALEKARDTGAIALSGRVELIQEQQRQFGVLVILPIYSQDAVLETVSSRRQHLQGFVLGVFRLADIIRNALPGLNLENIDFYLYDRSDVPGDSFLAAYDAEAKRVAASPTAQANTAFTVQPFASASPRSATHHSASAQTARPYKSICTRNFDIADRQWSLVLAPTTAYVDRAELYQQSRIRADAATAEATKLKQALQNLQQTQARWLLEKKLIAAGVGLVLLVLAGANAGSFWNMSRLLHSKDKIEQTYSVLASLAKLGSVSTATGRSTGRSIGQPPTASDIDPALTVLREATVNNAVQQTRFTRLARLLAQPLPSTQLSVEPQVRSMIAEMEAEARSQLRSWQLQAETSAQAIFWINLTGIFLSFALLLGVYYLLQRQITERQQVESALYQANNQLELEVQEREAELAHTRELTDLKLRLFSMVSHEFRNPLSTILVSTQLLSSSQDWPEERKVKNLSRIQTAAKTMAQLLSDILTLNRAEAGKLEFRPEPIDVEPFCRRVIEDVQYSTAAQQSIHFVSDTRIPSACFDSKLLNSILSNLLANAIKYSAPTSSIQFRLSSTPTQVYFQIQDQGIGIPADDLPRLYDAFYRGQNIGEVVGTGLGLAVAKTCVDLHGGYIEVDSEIDKGTLFTVTLPHHSC
ncbi:CHASE domain-containing protein [Oculatella sp. LEGE 06141]|uniref:CHASE domain-containing sensor histidine kinase n=1 Tax=Oculatella sp. LEGE 06141 TaxID=1828648 RepID=UPI00188209AA|nr:CHASE domain-containing protein [Oculatella sp. LEGE 06141]MBE9179854.1 CHASE domain-containing protein [Oculatella sp. LEGE 06141]